MEVAKATGDAEDYDLERHEKRYRGFKEVEMKVKIGEHEKEIDGSRQSRRLEAGFDSD